MANLRQLNWTEIGQLIDHIERQLEQATHSSPPTSPQLPGHAVEQHRAL